jgi:ankyrin repeat protein
MSPKRLLATLLMTIAAAVGAYADEIHTAAQAGDLARVQALVSARPELADAPDDRQCRPVHFAAGGNHVEVLAFLAEHGVGLSPVDADGDTPLHWAAIEGHREAADWLLDHGVDLNARNHELDTPLLYAVKRLRYEMVEHLVRRGADIELPNDYGRTPLLWTVREGGDLRMARLLLNLGADVNARDGFGTSSLSLAAWRGFKTLVGVLLDHGAEVEVGGEEGTMLLAEAVGRGIPGLYTKLIAAGIEIPVGRTKQGCLIHRAAAGGSPEIVADLIARGANTNEADDYGWTALHYAAAQSHAEAVTKLLQHVDDPNRRTRSGYTALNLATEHGGEEAARILRARGVHTSPRAFPVLTGPYLGQSSPGSRPAPFALDIVATPHDQHGNVAFSPDGLEAYWGGCTETPDSGYSYGTILCSRQVDGRWTAPQMAPFAAERQGDDVPFFSPDGQRLFFVSRRPLTPGLPLGKENIWVITRRGTGWGEPEPLPPAINHLDLHWQFSVAANGNLYFGARTTTAETKGVYLSRFVNGQYAEAEFLGLPGEAPFVPPDERYLMTCEFGRDGPHNLIRFRRAGGGWDDPIDITAVTNRGIGGICPMVSPDGKYFFFIRDLDGNNNAWWVEADFIEELRARQAG